MITFLYITLVFSLWLMVHRKFSFLNDLSEGIIWLDKNLKVFYQNRAVEIIILKRLPKRKLSFSQTILSDQEESILHAIQSAKKKEHLFFTPSKSSTIALTILPISKGYLLTLTNCSSFDQVIAKEKSFISNASHELRTPITIIKGFAETLRDLPNISKEMSKEMIRKIVKNCVRMESVIKSLLVMTDLDQCSSLKVEECDINQLVEQTSKSAIALYPQAQIDCYFDQEQALIQGSSHLLEVLLRNLIQNGVKYSQEKPIVSVTVEHKKDSLSLKVKDKGIGMDREELNRVFDRFYTVDKAHSRKMGGAGLGLSIVKKIISLHQGKVSLSSSKGVGTEVVMELPLNV